MKRRVKRHAVIQPLDPSYRLIPLTQGQNAIVDTADFEFLSQWNWYSKWNEYTKSFYAARKPRSGVVYMHRIILSSAPGQEGDHKNHDTLDNRRKNLRNSTHSQNGCNSPKKSANQSGFKGVSWSKAARKWQVGIRVGEQRMNLGLFTSKEEAAHAYDEAAKVHHGEFASLNFPTS